MVQSIFPYAPGISQPRQAPHLAGKGLVPMVDRSADPFIKDPHLKKGKCRVSPLITEIYCD